MSDSPPQEVSAEDLHESSLVFSTSVILIALLVMGLSFTVLSAWKGTIFVALIWSLACLTIGIGIGFLFGIPRVGSGRKSTTPTAEGKLPSRTGLRINTNLEEISDWLTKIIVGLSLVEAKKIVGLLMAGGRYLGNDLGPGKTALATGIIVYFIALGIVSGYLLMRMVLSPAFRSADEFTSGTREARKAKAIADDAQQRITATLDLYDALDAAYSERMDYRLRGQLLVPAEIATEYERRLNVFAEDPRWKLSRRLHMLLANFLSDLGKDREAIEVLDRFLAAKRDAGQGNDIHAAAALYNLACYHARLAKKADNANDRNEMMREEHLAETDLRKSIAICSANGIYAKEDSDFTDLRAKNPAFKALTGGD